IGLADAYCGIGRYNIARTTLEDGFNRTKNAEIKEHLDDFDRYARLFARDVDRDAVNRLKENADELMKTGEYTAAADVYREVIDMDPTDVDGYFGLAESLLKQGRRGEAKREIEQAYHITGDYRLDPERVEIDGDEIHYQVLTGFAAE
ncbi:MAG: tetratricopeptide repeat protein, partial [Oscillospiraceae bacterium]